MSDEIEIPPLKKFKAEAASSTSNGEPRDRSVRNTGSGNFMSNINSSNAGLQIANYTKIINQRENSTSRPSVKTLLHNENYSPSPWFSGRREYLQKLEKAVKDTRKKDATFHYVVISGLWGMGKSQVARKFIEQHKHEDAYGGNVFWINASSGAQMIQSFLRLARHFHIDIPKHFKLDQGQGQGQNQGQELIEDVKKLVKDIYAHFDEHVGQGIFVFDGAKQFAAPTSTPHDLGVNIFLPNRQKHSNLIPTILITSRSQDWPKQCKVLPPLSPFNSFESEDFIKMALDLPNNSNHDYPESLRPLCSNIDGFPLVLAQVCAKIDDIMNTAHSPNWNVNFPYNLGPKNMRNTKLEDEIQKLLNEWNTQSPLALLSAQNLPEAPTHSDSYTSYVPFLWKDELTFLENRENHKMALPLLQFISYLPQTSISVKLLYFIIHDLPINSQSVQNLKSASFNEINYDLGLLAKRSLITLDKSEREQSGQKIHNGFYHEDNERWASPEVGHLKLQDFFLENNCGKILVPSLVQRLMRCSLHDQETPNFQPLLKIVDFYLKNTKSCQDFFYDNWPFFTYVKQLNWPGHSYIAELYRILYIGNALNLRSNWIYSVTNIEELKKIYDRLNQRGRKNKQELVHFKLCRLAIIVIGHQAELTCIKNDDLSAILNNYRLLPQGDEYYNISIRDLVTSAVELMMENHDNFVVWFCGAQIFLQLNSAKVINVKDAICGSHGNGNFNCNLEYNVNNEKFGDKKDQVITEDVWDSGLLRLRLRERVSKLINFYFNSPSTNRNERKGTTTQNDVQTAELMLKVADHLFDLPVYKKILMNVQFLSILLDDREPESDQVKLGIWEKFVQNIQRISIWSCWLPEKMNLVSDVDGAVWHYNGESSRKIKTYFMDRNGAKTLEILFVWLQRILRKYQCVQNDFACLMISVFEILQELCFDSSNQEQFLESDDFISSFQQLFSALMQNRFADKENLMEFRATFSCAVSCLTLTLLLSTPTLTKSKSKSSSSTSTAKEKSKLEKSRQILFRLEDSFFWKYKPWTQDIPNFEEKAKRTIYRTKERSRVILEKVMQTRRRAENFKEDDLKVAQILMNFCPEPESARNTSEIQYQTQQ